MPRLFDPSTLGKYGRLALVARGLVEGFLTGIHKSPYKGASVEFAEHRQYYPGDEIRHIDWRAVAKTERYYVKEFEEETNLRLHLLVDASGSMAYRGAHPSKWQHAQHVAASLAYLMLRQRDAVGLALHDTKLRSMLKPKANAKHLLQVLNALEAARPEGETALAPLWHRIAGQIRQRGMVVIVSDCFGDPAALLKAMQHLRHRRHEVMVFHVLAPEEIEFPFKKWTQFKSLESPDRRLVDPQRLRKEYLANFDRFRAELRQACGKCQADYHLLRTDEPVERALGLYLSRRQRQR
ncbi:MAG: DUF58 domain-containing protein [Gemmataceae bacterium]|nr:DUF58 domain-containing protein [Gemmataceae bacterium]